MKTVAKLTWHNHIVTWLFSKPPLSAFLFAHLLCASFTDKSINTIWLKIYFNSSPREPVNLRKNFCLWNFCGKTGKTYFSWQFVSMVLLWNFFAHTTLRWTWKKNIFSLNVLSTIFSLFSCSWEGDVGTQKKFQYYLRVFYVERQMLFQ
jgi:hypothetical protein